MLAVTGRASTIVEALLSIMSSVGGFEPVYSIPRGSELAPADADRFVFAHGVLHKTPEAELTLAEKIDTMAVNYQWTATLIDRVIATNDRARIVVVGSESAYQGSADVTYADSKRLLHTYVERKRLRTPDQQLVAISPGIIGDAGMTMRRQDPERVAARAQAHPKRRHVTSLEVARLIHFLLYEDRGYISGTVIRMHGGETWR